MQISIRHLQNYLPGWNGTSSELIELLNDIGLEVTGVQKKSDDTVLTIEVLANRGDHLSYWGVAKEISGRLFCDITPPHSDMFPVMGESVAIHCTTPLCLQYSASLFLVDQFDAPLPSEILYPLTLSDIHSVNPIVDLTNLANLEWGQPTHAFDADKIKGPIAIRLSQEKEKAHLLFQEEPIELPSGLLVIADNEKILAIAGVIGCEESKATVSSKRILLESATFDRVAVRKASTFLKTRTLSSARFEKGADPTMMMKAVFFIANALEKNNVAHFTGRTSIYRQSQMPDKKISLDLTHLNAYFNTDRFTQEDVIRRLAAYGFIPIQNEKPKTLTFKVPSHRIWDVENTIDLYEELARSVGYDQLPSTLPNTSCGALPSKQEIIKENVNQLLIGQGFQEIFTNSFYGKDTIKPLSLTEKDPWFSHVEVINSQSRAYSLLKRACLPQALTAVSSNLRFHTKDIKLFEWSHVFIPNQNTTESLCQEEGVLWIVTHGQENTHAWNGTRFSQNVWGLKGIVEELNRTLDLGFSFAHTTSNQEPTVNYLHPARSLLVMQNDKVVGCLGEVHPTIAQAYDIKHTRPCYLELKVETLWNGTALRTPKQAPELPTFLPIVRMLTLHISKGITSASVKTCLLHQFATVLSHVEISDVFAPPEKQDTTAVTFSLKFHTYGEESTETINRQLFEMVAHVEQTFGKDKVFLK